MSISRLHGKTKSLGLTIPVIGILAQNHDLHLAVKASVAKALKISSAGGKICRVEYSSFTFL